MKQGSQRGWGRSTNYIIVQNSRGNAVLWSSSNFPVALPTAALTPEMTRTQGETEIIFHLLVTPSCQRLQAVNLS